MTDPDSVRDAVRARYAEAAARVFRGDSAEARARGASCCAGSADAGPGGLGVFGSDLHDPEAADGATEVALAASLGCGVPTAVADLHPGEVVLDLGSGAGADKSRVLAEAARVLRPAGRFAVSDVLADASMDEATRADMAAWTGCIAGALTRAHYSALLEAAGMIDVEITETHRVHPHASAALIRARKPSISPETLVR